jgi:hypothetical protein
MVHISALVYPRSTPPPLTTLIALAHAGLAVRAPQPVDDPGVHWAEARLTDGGVVRGDYAVARLVTRGHISGIRCGDGACLELVFFLLYISHAFYFYFSGMNSEGSLETFFFFFIIIIY